MAKPEYPSDKLDQYMVRFPDGMRDRLKQAAADNNRSLNAEIIARLAASFITIEGDPQPTNVDPTKALYVLLDANGHPTSWPEVEAHLSALRRAGDFSPEVMEARVFNTNLRSGSDREDQWWDLLMHYRKLHGLPEFDVDPDQ